MALTLLVGPANAGKVARLLDRYAAQLDRDPVLIVPNRSDVDVVERVLLERTPALIGGWIGTFDDLFSRIANGDGGHSRVVGEAERMLVVRRAIERCSRDGLRPSARFPGFAEALLAALREVESGLLEPGDLDGDLGDLYAAYRAELASLELSDRELERRRAVERLEGELPAWRGEPVFAYGFEDLTGAEWALLRSLAGRTDVTVSLPYEPGRIAFESLARTAAELQALASGRVEELPPRSAELRHPALAHLERSLFADRAGGEAPPLEGAIRFLEGAGTRGTLELVGDEILQLIRGGTSPEAIGVVCANVAAVRAALETAFVTLGIPHALEADVRLAETPFGHALLGLLRFAWLGGDRGDLFRFLRSPYSGLGRASVDFVEGRLRGRAVALPERIEEEMQALRGARLPALDALREAPSPLVAVRELAGSMLRAAHGLERAPQDDGSRGDLRAYEGCARLLDELERWEQVAGRLARDDVVAALDRATVRLDRTAEPGRVAVLDLMRARTRRFEAVFVLGLEEGSLPRRGHQTPFLDDEARHRLGGTLVRPDRVSRDRYLFYTACTRPTRRLYLVRQAATDEGSPREPSAFWEEVATLFSAEDVARATRRRRLSALTWPLERAPSERERVRALASLSAEPEGEASAAAIARANGWERRLHRARTALERRTRLRHPLVLEELSGRSTFGVTELERFADCSSAWFVERLLDPRTIDAEIDAKLRGSVAHAALFKLFSNLGRELGSDRLEQARVDDALRLLRRSLAEALEGVRVEMTPIQRAELEQSLYRDLEQLVRHEAASEPPLVPRQFEVLFGSERAAPALQRGLAVGDGVTLSGKIDRIDVDPFSARGIVQDYKAGKGAHSAREIERELRLQIPLYMLVLRDLVGIEPLGGVYRPLAGDRKARGLLREDARGDVLRGYVAADYLDEAGFWTQVEGAKDLALRFAERIRAGDVRHDPKGGECPAWCDLWPMCRVRRA